MRLEQIDDNTYLEFWDAYPYQNFWQSLSMCHFRQERLSWDYECVGLYNDQNELAAACTLQSMPSFGKYKAYTALRGFLIDYDDTGLVDTFLGLLKEYLHEHDCLYMKTDPYTEYQSRTKDGEPYGEKRDDLIGIFEKHGFKHEGFGELDTEVNEPRFMSVLPLQDKTAEEIFAGFHAQTRQNINNTEKEGIKIRELGEDEMDKLSDLVSLTGGKREFFTPDASYYKFFKECFGENMKAYYAYLDVNDYIDRYQKVIDEEENKIAELGDGELSKKQQSRKNQSLQKIASAKKRVAEGEELLKEAGAELPLAAAMFVFTDYEVVYLFSGSDDTYKHFKAPYAIQWKIIQEAKEKGAQRYNFYGISGHFNEDEEGYGVYLFKKGFGADVVELIGSFQYVDRPKEYKLYSGLRKIKHTFIK